MPVGHPLVLFANFLSCLGFSSFFLQITLNLHLALGGMDVLRTSLFQSMGTAACPFVCVFSGFSHAA